MSARADALGIDPTIPEDVPQAQTTAIDQSLGLGGLLNDPEARGAIARETLGDDVADRYGDALGIRKRGFNDFLRDFSLNMASKDPDKARAVQQQLRESLEETYQRRQEEGRRLRQEAMQKNTAFMDLIERAPKLQLPRKFKIGYVVSMSEQIGRPITKEVAELIVDGQVPIDVLRMPEFNQALDDDPMEAANILTQFGANITTATEIVDGMQKLKANKEHAAMRADRLTEGFMRQRERKLRIRTGKLRARKLRLDLKKGKSLTGDPLLDWALGQGGGVTPGTGPVAPEGIDEAEVRAAEERLGIPQAE